jgi:hypothetical protein
MAGDKQYGGIKPPQASEPTESNVVRRFKRGPGEETLKGIKKRLAGKVSAVKEFIGVGKEK